MKQVQNVANNDSTLKELCERYENRGKNYSRSRESTEQKSREISTRTRAPKSYKVSGGENLHQYKSGVSGSKRYMTDSDFDRYYKSRRDYVANSSVKLDLDMELSKVDRDRYNQNKHYTKASQGKNDVKSKLKREAAINNPRKKEVAKPNSKPKPKPNPKTSQNSKDNSQKIKQTVKKAAKEWVPVREVAQERIVEGGKSQIPIGTIITIAVIAISLLLILGSTVLLGSAKSRCNELENSIYELDLKIDELESELDKKNADADIEVFAIEELGMISQEHVRVEYINNNKTDEVVENGKSSTLTSLIEWFFPFLK